MAMSQAIRKSVKGVLATLPQRLREKENYKNLEILKVDTIKLGEMKEKNTKKNISDEQENFPKPNYIAEISSKR